MPERPHHPPPARRLLKQRERARNATKFARLISQPALTWVGRRDAHERFRAFFLSPAPAPLGDFATLQLPPATCHLVAAVQRGARHAYQCTIPAGLARGALGHWAFLPCALQMKQLRIDNPRQVQQRVGGKSLDLRPAYARRKLDIPDGRHRRHCRRKLA